MFISGCNCGVCSDIMMAACLCLAVCRVHSYCHVIDGHVALLLSLLGSKDSCDPSEALGPLSSLSVKETFSRNRLKEFHPAFSTPVLLAP